jgi:hypothetical protein
MFDLERHLETRVSEAQDIGAEHCEKSDKGHSLYIELGTRIVPRFMTFRFFCLNV